MKKRLLFMAFILYTMSMICACGTREESAVPVVSDLSEEEGWEEADTLSMEAASGTVHVRVDNCKVKKGPGEEYETVGTLGLLEELWVTGRVTAPDGTEWYQIAVPKILEREPLPDGAYYVQAGHVKE